MVMLMMMLVMVMMMVTVAAPAAAAATVVAVAACWYAQQHATDAQRTSRAAGGDGRRVEFLNKSKGSCKEATGRMGGANWASAVLAVVMSAIWFYLAENVGGPGAQNTVCSKEFQRSRWQAMGGGVRRADRGPKTSDL